MHICERIKTERVLYDQRVFLRDDEKMVPLGLPTGVHLVSITSPVIQIDVVECEVDFGPPPPSPPAAGALIRALLIIEFVGHLTDNTTRNFEFSFPIEANVALPKLNRTLFTEDEIARAICQVFDVQTNGHPKLTCHADTFDVFVEIAVKLKIAVLDQIVVALCPHANSQTLSGGQITIVPCTPSP